MGKDFEEQSEITPFLQLSCIVPSVLGWDGFFYFREAGLIGTNANSEKLERLKTKMRECMAKSNEFVVSVFKAYLLDGREGLLAWVARLLELNMIRASIGQRGFF